jgi:hypothetical protein
MSVKGQTILIIVFTLTFSLFSLLMLLAPIKDKLLRIKDMENVFQAVANSQKGLEIVLLDALKPNVFVSPSFAEIYNNINITDTTWEPPIDDCGGIGYSSNSKCILKTYKSVTGTLWGSEVLFTVDRYILENTSSGSTAQKIFSGGFKGKNVRILNTRQIK